MSCRRMMKQMIFAAIILVAGVASADISYVDQKHPAAADENPGTAESPWKTIGHATEVARAGDTVCVKGGLYREGNLWFRNSGKRILDYQNGNVLRHPQPSFAFKYITIQAEGPEPVIVDGSVEIPPDQWKPVEGVKDVFVTPVLSHGFPKLSGGEEGPVQILWVFRDGQLLEAKVGAAGLAAIDGSYKPAMGIPGTADAWKWYHDIGKGLLYVNFGGKSPAQAGRIEASVYPSAFQGFHGEYIALRGLTIQRFGRRTVDFTYSVGTIIEDCLLRHCASEAISSSVQSIVRRNTILDANGIAITPGSYSLVDENLVIRNFRDVLQTKYPYMGTAITFFGRDGIRFRNNVVLDSPGNGFWPDCPSSSDHVYLGNTVGRCKAYGFYIEMPAVNNVVINNVIFNTGGDAICLRGNFNNTVSGNYIYGSRSGIALIQSEIYPWMFNNQIVGNWIKNAPLGIYVGGGMGGRPQTLQFTDRNTFDPSVQTVAKWDGKDYKTLAEYQQTGNEHNGAAKPVNEAELGLVSFRVADSLRPWEPVLMFGNPKCSVQRVNWGSFIYHNQPYFWHYGTADGDESLRWDWKHPGNFMPMTDFGGVLRASAAEADWGGYLVSENADGDRLIKERQKADMDSGVLEVASEPGKTISPRGLGFWSPSLPTAPGAVTDLLLHAQIKGVTSAQQNGGVTVFVEWSDYTRRQIQREYIVGVDDKGQTHLPALTGTQDYAPIAAAVTAPDWARRMRLFMGMKNCSGAVLFDDIDTFAARPEKPEEPKKLAQVQPEKNDSPLMDPAGLEFHVVDLSKVVNRALRDERADDGQGGWTDQGSGADLRGLNAGNQQFQGVPFEILAPNAAVVLNSSRRPQSKLPEKVSVDVNLKADVLYFLQDGAWGGEKEELARYIIHYEDGSTAEIPLIGGMNILDWSLGTEAKFTKKATGQRASVAVALGGGALYPTVNVYLLEWLNPHPDKTVATIDFVSANAGVPILLAITAGQQK